MTTKAINLRKTAQELQDKVRVQLLEAANKCATEVTIVLPAAGEGFTPLTYAKVRWEMLKAGFRHAEIAGIMSKIKAYYINNGDTAEMCAQDFIETVVLKYLEPIDENTSTFDLYIFTGEYQDRLAGKILNAHERLVFLIGKQLDILLVNQEPDRQSRMIKRISEQAECSEELIWRIATGGLRVPRAVLEKVNKIVRYLNAELAEAALTKTKEDDDTEESVN